MADKTITLIMSEHEAFLLLASALTYAAPRSSYIVEVICQQITNNVVKLKPTRIRHFIEILEQAKGKSDFEDIEAIKDELLNKLYHMQEVIQS